MAIHRGSGAVRVLCTCQSPAGAVPGRQRGRRWGGASTRRRPWGRVLLPAILACAVGVHVLSEAPSNGPAPTGSPAGPTLGVSVAAPVAWAHGGGGSDDLAAGGPVAVDRPTGPGAPVAGRGEEAGSTWVVAPGETLWSIARSLAPGEDPRRVVEAIRRANHLRSAVLRVGQRLILPPEMGR